MLNEWSDRVPPPPPRRFYRRSEVWLGLSVAALCAGFVLGLLSCGAR